VATPQDRLHDALVSLRFLLQMEVLAQLNNPEDKNEVMLFLKFVINLLPEQTHDPFLRFLVFVNSVDKVNSADVDTAALDAFGDEYSNWMVCGVSSSDVSTRGGGAKKMDGLFSRAQEGYLCGLWMLFHYLTVAAEERFILSITEVLSSSTVDAVTVTTLDVMANVRLCVDKFFNCRHCRLHFLDNFSQCKFGRCDIKKSQFDKLQSWLWHFHNYVTHSILHYHLSPDNREDGTEAYYKHVVSWPDHRKCSSCYEVPDVVSKHSAVPVNKFLREAYWSKSWKLCTIREYKPEYEHALQNPFSSSSSSFSSSSPKRQTGSTTALHPVMSSSVPSSLSETHPESQEDTFFTLGIISLVGIFLMVLIALFLSCKKRSKPYSSAAFRRGRYL
jgi:hypothetical protein